MSKGSFVDNKEELFKRGKSQKDIFGGREILEATSLGELVEIHQIREKNQAVVLHGVNIIPPEFYSAQNFSKRGSFLELNTLGGDEKKLIEYQWSPIKARIQACEQNLGSEQPYIGWSWSDPEEYVHFVRPTSVIEGRRLQFLKSGITDKAIVKKEYYAKDSHLRSYSVVLPSKSRKRPRKVVLENLTKPNDPRRFAEWTRFRTVHDCPFKRNDFTFVHPKVVRYDHHEVCAHGAYTRDMAKKKKKVLQPFPLFTEPFLRLGLSLMNDTMIVDVKRERGKVKTRTRQLSFPEIDRVLMFAHLGYGHRNTLFVPSQTKQYRRGPAVGKRKRMSEYDWSVSAEGMAFRFD